MEKYNPEFVGVRSMEVVLEKYLNELVDKTWEYETENIETGWNYINRVKGKVNYENIKKHIDKYANDKLLALFTLAEEEDISRQKVKNLLFECSYVEPTSGIGRENFLCYTQVPPEKEINVHIPGTLNGKKVTDIYQTICDQIPNKELLKRVQNRIRNLNAYEDGTFTVHIVQPTYWAAFVDENKFQEKLLQHLRLSETELEELTNVMNLS